MGILDDRGQLQGKIAVVIGGALGIGEAVSRALSEGGVDLAIGDWDTESLQATKAAAEKLGRRVFAKPVNVIEASEVEAFYDAVEEQFDRVDIVVNLAGGTRRRPFLTMTPQMWDEDIQRNFRYVVQSTRRAIPLFRAAGGGSIINFTTIEAHRGAGTFAVYAGAKAATENFTRAIATEFGPDRIRANTIVPDHTPSRGNRDALLEMGRLEMESLAHDYSSQLWKLRIPLGDQPLADELANGVLFLSSDLARYVTGVSLHIDGGTHTAGGIANWPNGDGWCPVPLSGSLPRLFGDPPYADG
jgi:NAD(P)-dependent dehydrogenase (short-subunit alcohol dehydrogenase family)